MTLGKLAVLFLPGRERKNRNGQEPVLTTSRPRAICLTGPEAVMPGDRGAVLCGGQDELNQTINTQPLCSR